MIDFILNDLNVEYSNTPIDFGLQFDIDRHKLSDLSKVASMSSKELEEIDYYNLACIDEFYSNQTNINIDLMKEFKDSIQPFLMQEKLFN